MSRKKSDRDHSYVGRGGLKLEHAIDALNIDVKGLRCADFGCSTGGFTDCLLQHDAAHVTAVDTGYGILEYKLRIDTRVTVLERTNILHYQIDGCNPVAWPIDLIVADVGWTPQMKLIPIAIQWLLHQIDAKPSVNPGRMITLIKPHYELSHLPNDLAASFGYHNDKAGENNAIATRSHNAKKRTQNVTVLDEPISQKVCDHILSRFPAMGMNVLGCVKSPIHGGGSRRKRKDGKGNVEYLAYLEIIENQ